MMSEAEDVTFYLCVSAFFVGTCSELPGPPRAHLPWEGGADLGERWTGVRGQGHLQVSRLDLVFLLLSPHVAYSSLISLYRQLLEMTCRLGNLLRRRGVKRGDCVTIYMPPCPLAVASMLACARIGAAHNVVFAGFSAEALADRIRDGETAWLVSPLHILKLHLSIFLLTTGQITFS